MMKNPDQFIQSINVYSSQNEFVTIKVIISICILLSLFSSVLYFHLFFVLHQRVFVPRLTEVYMILYLHLEVSQVLEVARIHGTSTTTSGGESTGSSPLTSLLTPLTLLLKRFMEYRTGNASLITTTIH